VGHYLLVACAPLDIMVLKIEVEVRAFSVPSLLFNPQPCANPLINQTGERRRLLERDWDWCCFLSLTKTHLPNPV
jgi:hypothetical protein